jgi:hypothetical protein
MAQEERISLIIFFLMRLLIAKLLRPVTNLH